MLLIDAVCLLEDAMPEYEGPQSMAQFRVHLDDFAAECLEAAPEPDTKEAQAMRFLRERLQAGPMEWEEVLNEATTTLQVGRDTVYKAKKRLRVISGKTEDGRTTWSLRGDAVEDDPKRSEAEAARLRRAAKRYFGATDHQLAVALHWITTRAAGDEVKHDFETTAYLDDEGRHMFREFLVALAPSSADLDKIASAIRNILGVRD